MYHNVSGSKILSKIPSAFKGELLLRQFDRDKSLFTVLVFPSQRKDVISSGAVKHMLADLLKQERLVAFGGCFTSESLALLRERCAEIFVLSDFLWSDESWGDSRARIGSHVKFPLQ